MTQSSSDFSSNPSTATSQSGGTASSGKARRSTSAGQSAGSAGSAGSARAGSSSSIGSESQKLVGVGRRMASTWLDGRKDALTQTFTSTAEGLRRLGDSYGDQPNIKSYIDAAADGLETVSEELGNQRIEDLARQAETFSRNYPVTVFAGAVAAGLVVSRILRSAAEGGLEGDGSGHARQGRAEPRGAAGGRSRAQGGDTNT
jgi:hypothetical protein